MKTVNTYSQPTNIPMAGYPGAYDADYGTDTGMFSFYNFVK
jgi:hypothetical protein